MKFKEGDIVISLGGVKVQFVRHVSSKRFEGVLIGHNGQPGYTSKGWLYCAFKLVKSKPKLIRI